jgi:hypothetical protein
MHKELYFDISSQETGGSLYRVSQEGKPSFFYYSYSTYDEARDEIRVFEKKYPDFASFWSELKGNPEWFYLHPLFIHPEQRDYIRQELQEVNWSVQPDRKWQESHQRQWKKVLEAPENYYRKD